MKKIKILIILLIIITLSLGLVACDESNGLNKVVQFETNTDYYLDDVTTLFSIEGYELPVLADTSTELFDGWYYDEALTDPCGSTIDITKSMVLYAKWTAYELQVETYQVSVINDEYDINTVLTVESGTSLTPSSLLKLIDNPLLKSVSIYLNSHMIGYAQSKYTVTNSVVLYIDVELATISSTVSSDQDKCFSIEQFSATSLTIYLDNGETLSYSDFGSTIEWQYEQLSTNSYQINYSIYGGVLTGTFEFGTINDTAVSMQCSDILSDYYSEYIDFSELVFTVTFASGATAQYACKETRVSSSSYVAYSVPTFASNADYNIDFAFVDVYGTKLTCQYTIHVVVDSAETAAILKYDSTGIVTGIKDDAACPAILVIPESIDGVKLTAIDNKAFDDETALTTVVLNGNITAIGASAFSGCVNLVSVTGLSTKYTYINSNVFYGCVNLTTFGTGDTADFAYVTNISSNAFYNCEKLQISIPSSVVSIGSTAFYGVDGLQTVTLRSSASAYGEACFYDTTIVNLVVETSANVVSLFSQSKTVEFIVSGVLTIVNNNTSAATFAQSSRVTAYTWVYNIADSTAGVASDIFAGSSTVRDITIAGTGSTVIAIYNSAFANCTNLENIAFSNYSTITLGSAVFSGCSSLTQLTISDVVFSYNLSDDTARSLSGSSISKLTVTDTAELSEGEFKDNTVLTAVYIGSLSSVPEYAFAGCTNLTSLVLGSSMSANDMYYIDDYAFEYCNIATLDLSDVSGVSEYALYNFAFGSVDIGNNSSWSLDNGVLYYNYSTYEQYLVAATSASNEVISVGDTVVSIYPNAFYNATKTTKLYLYSYIAPTIGEGFTVANYGNTTLQIYVNSLSVEDYKVALGMDDVLTMADAEKVSIVFLSITDDREVYKSSYCVAGDSYTFSESYDAYFVRYYSNGSLISAEQLDSSVYEISHVTTDVFISADGDLILDSPINVTYDGSTLDWDDVSGAERYNVVINGGTIIVVSYSQYSYTNCLEQFTVAITSVCEDVVSLTVAYTFVQLGEVTNLAYDSDTGSVTWDAVTNADQYSIMLNGEIVATVSSTQFSGLVEGTNSIQVMPVCSTNATYYGTWSDAYSLELLSAPTGLSYSENTNVISWDSVDGASSYNLNINNTTVNTTSTNYTYQLEDGMCGDIVLAVQAVSSSDSICSSAYSSSETYTYLEPITGLTAVDGEVMWDDIAPNGQYMVTITTTVNGESSTTTRTVSTNILSDLTSGVDYTISVKALPANDNQFSSYSEAIEVYFLSTPTLTISDATDDQIAFAISAGNSENRIASYQLLILKDGVQVVNTVLASDATGYSTYTFDEVGEYTVSIKANAYNNEEDYEFDSKYSDAITVVRLGSISNLAVNEGTNTSSDYFTFSASSNATSSTTYNYSVGPYSGSVNTLSFDMPADDTADEQSYLVSVYAAGSGSTTVNGKYYLSSTVQTVAVTKLATPTSLTWTGDSKLSWTGVSSASNYTLSVGGVESTSNGTDLSYTFSQAGEYLIKVQASGSYNNFIIDSNYSDEITVTKLATPELSVDAYGYLTWDSSFGQTVSGFTVSCSGSIVTTTTNEVSQFDINSYINTTAPTVISVVAVGAATTDDIHFFANSELSSVYVAKLASTTIYADIDNNIVSWDAVSNANTYYYTRTDSNDTLVEIKSTDATNVSTADFASCSIAVYAEGYYNSSTGVYYVQSEVEYMIIAITSIAGPPEFDGSDMTLG